MSVQDDTRQDDTRHEDAQTDTAEPVTPPVGDWLVVPSPPTAHLWRWGRIVAVIPGDPLHYRVRWFGDTHDTVVLPPPDARIESATRWPTPGSGAIGLWPGV